MDSLRPPIVLPPQQTSFIGRETEIAEILSHLDDSACRLLTLVGPGGSGKTRLAIEATHRTDFQEGVYFVPLQPLELPDQVTDTIVSVLNLRPGEGKEQKQALLDYLQSKHVLLVLDNFEHVLPAADLITDILNAAPQVKLIVTSREPLKLHEEWVREVRGLTYPHNGANTPESHYSAPQLFADRARRQLSGFSLDADYPHVVHICRLVDGLPLALELAAGWLRTLTCKDIAHEIEHNVDILTSKARNIPDRHRSMRAVFDYSWRLLTAEEQRVMRQFAVFRGGYTRDATQQIAGASLPLLADLVEKSLLRHNPNTGRYDMQELLRQFAEAKLEEAGETEITFDKHANYFLSFMQGREADLKGSRQIEALSEIEADFENVRAAWQRTVQSHHHALVNTAVESLFLFTILRSRLQDHTTLFSQALAEFAPRSNDDPSLTWGRIMARSHHFFTTNYSQPQPTAIANSEVALNIARRSHDTHEIALCLYLLGKLTIPAGAAQALVFLEESLQHFAEIGEHFYRAYLLQDIFQCRNWLGQLEPAIAARNASLELCRIYDLRSPLARVLNQTGIDEAFRNGHFLDGERYIREAVTLCRSMNSRGETARYMRWLSTVVFVQGRVDEAQGLAEECRAIAYEVHDFEFLSVSSAITGMVYNLQGDYRRGEELGQESFSHAATPPVVFWTHWSLASAYCGLDNLTTASDYLRLALQQIENIVTQSGFKALCVPLAAYLCSRRNRAVEAVELLALAFTDTKSPTGWLEKWSLMNELQADLAAELGDEAYLAAWDRGVSLDLNRVARDLLREFSSPGSDPVADANQALPEPLTSRELEMLQLVAEGLTNAQIGERLFITTGTVKWHLNRVFQKLDVQHRQQAVIKARALQLLKT